MKKLLITIFLIVSVNKIYSQENDLLGHWVLSEHFVYDTTLNKQINIYSGQLNRAVDFYENGTLKLTLNSGTKVNGTWKISKNGRKFTIKSDLNFAKGLSDKLKCVDKI